MEYRNNCRRFMSEEERDKKYEIYINSLLTPINQITHKLYIGNREAGKSDKLLGIKGIEAVLQIADRSYEINDGRIRKYIAIIDEPGQDISKYFKASYKFIDDMIKQDKRILVHCDAGVSRSSTIVIHYLMKKYGFTAKQAYNYVKKQRPCIKPNDGFIHALNKI